MSMKQILAAAVMTLTLNTVACAKSEPEQPSKAPAQQQMNHESMGMDHSQMKDDCDMQGMDMSNMSAEEHQAMMDKCQKDDAASDGQTDPQHDDHGGH